MSEEIPEYKIEFNLSFFRTGLSWATMNWVVSWGKDDSGRNQSSKNIKPLS